METVQQAYVLSPRSNSPSAHPLVMPGRVGLEIELERMDIPYGRNGHWNVIEEDSLRDGGVEFVTLGDGKEGVEIIESIDELMHILDANQFSPSWRCSTHAHIDVRHMNLPALKRFILGGIVTEDVLYEAAGGHRKNSNFCMPFMIAEELGMILARNWHHETIRGFVDGVNREWTKYAGMNLLPINRLGTIEFRNSEPKHNRGTLLRLVNRYLALQEYAINFEGTDLEFVQSLADEESVRNLMCMGLRRSHRINKDKLQEGLINCLDIINYNRFSLDFSDLPEIDFEIVIRPSACDLARNYKDEMGVVMVQENVFRDNIDFFKFVAYYFSRAENYYHATDNEVCENINNWYGNLSEIQKDVLRNM